MIIHRKLAFKISLYILTGIFVVFVFIILYNYHVSRKIVLQEAETNAFNLSQSTLHQIEKTLLPAENIPKNFALILESNTLTQEKLEHILRTIVQKNSEIFGSCIAFEPYAFRPDLQYYAPYFYRSGDSIAFRDLGKGKYNYTVWDWYQKPKEAGPCWGEPYFDKGGGNIIMVTYSVPFFLKGRDSLKFRGVVTVDLSLETLRQLISRMKIYETGYAFLLSPNGTYISHPDSTLEVKESIFSFAEKHHQTDLAVIGKQMVEGITSFQRYYSLYLNEDCYLFHTSLQSNKWSLAVVIPEKEIIHNIYILNLRIFLFEMVGFFMILVIIIIISRNITKPVRKLADAARIIGSGQFDMEMPEIKTKDEIGELALSFHQMRGHLKDYIQNLKEVTAARQKIESELKIAYDIQQDIIPKTFPPYPDRSDIDIFAALIPALQVGGDLYDYFFVDDDVLAVIIGDVSGKGIPASLLMAITRTLFRSRTHKKMTAREIVQDMNSDLVMENERAMFVTCFLGVLNLNTGDFEYCNAGHNYPYILRSDGELLCLDETHGTPLGISMTQPYGHNKILLNQGDRLFLFTDGVTEAMDAVGEAYGEERLENTLTSDCKGITVKETAIRVMESLAEFTRGAEQSDDITLLVLSCDPTRKKSVPLPVQKSEIYLRNDLNELNRLNAFLEETCSGWGLDQEMIFQLNMAAEEVVTNIIQYGYKEKPVTDEVKIELIQDQGELRICITDHGNEFNPLKVPPPKDLDKPARERKVGGLGVYLIRRMMDRVDYQRDQDGNKLVLTKNIHTPFNLGDDDSEQIKEK